MPLRDPEPLAAAQEPRMELAVAPGPVQAAVAEEAVAAVVEEAAPAPVAVQAAVVAVSAARPTSQRVRASARPAAESEPEAAWASPAP